MNWFKENKFVAGVLVATVIGAGGLTYLLLGSKSKYDENATVFAQQSGELKRLQQLEAYPDKQNLEILESQRVAHLGLIADLHNSLVATEIPVEPTSPNGFQDQLRAAVTQFTARAATAGLELPKGFYLGFAPYQAAPPTPEAAPQLARQLKIIQIVLQKLLDNHVAVLREFRRDVLPEEGGKKATPEPAKPAAKKPGEKVTAPVEPLVKSHSIDLSFVSDQKAVREILNSIVTNKEQFLIPRYVGVYNSRTTGPSKEGAAETPDAAAPPADNPGVPGEKAKSLMIFGEEKLTTVLRVEIVDFARPAPVATPAPRGNRTPAK